jgi:putative transposase
MARMMQDDGAAVNCKRVQRLMRLAGMAAVGTEAADERTGAGARDIPVSAARLRIDRPNQVWAADITYLPVGRGFLYLVAVMDWASRAVLSWRLSNTIDFCVAALEEALARFGKPEI